MIEQNTLFSKIYAIDTATHYYMIGVGLDHDADGSNAWDSAPSKRRDVDPDLARPSRTVSLLQNLQAIAEHTYDFREADLN